MPRRRKGNESTKISHPADPLDELLTYWERKVQAARLCNEANLILTDMDITVPNSFTAFASIPWHNLRSYLLDYEGGAIDGRFFPTESSNMMERSEAAIPAMVAHWSKSSRRVFTLDSVMLEKLDSFAPDGLEASLGNMLMPFSSFLLSFPDGLVLPGNEQRFTGMLVSRGAQCPVYIEHLTHKMVRDRHGGVSEISVKPTFSVWLINENMTSLASSEMRITELSRAIRKRDPKQMTKCVVKVMQRHERNEKLLKGLLVRNDAKAIQMRRLFFPRVPGARNPLWSQAYYMIVAFNRYIQAAGTTGTHTSDWNGRIPAGPADVIRRMSEVFVVPYQADLMQRARGGSGISSGGGDPVRPHVRRAHMRRPPGTSLDHPKTIPVRQAIVREDRVPPGTVIPGTETTLK